MTSIIDKDWEVFNYHFFIWLWFELSLLTLKLVYDQNRVSVSGTETKVQFWYLYRSRNFFSETETFFLQSFPNILLFFRFLWGHKFLKAWNWTQIFKNNLKIFNIWLQTWFNGPFYDWKNAPYYWYRLQYRPKVSANLGFGFGPKPK